MDIMYCGDRGIARGVLYSMVSLLRQTSEPLSFHLVTATIDGPKKRYEALTLSDAQWLQQVARTYQPQSSVTLYDLSEQFASEPPRANMRTRFTPGCMLRLYVDQVASFPRRVLYLDYDVLCRRDPCELFHLDLGEAELAGVPDNFGQWLYMGGPFKRQYLNSGVLLLDLDNAEKTALLARSRACCATKRMFMPDQSALNHLAKKVILPRRFNEQRRLAEDTVLQHFCTSWRFVPFPHIVTVKPWDRTRMHSVLDLYEYDPLLDECERLEADRHE